MLVLLVVPPLYGCEIWIASGHGAKNRYIPCHLISQVLGSHAAWELLLACCMGFLGAMLFLPFGVLARKLLGLLGAVCLI